MVQGYDTFSEDAVKERVASVLIAALNEGMTQTQIAQEIGVSQSAVAKYLDCTSKPSMDTLARIAHMCRISLCYLVTGLDIDEGRMEALEEVFLGIKPPGQKKLWDMLAVIASVERQYQSYS